VEIENAFDGIEADLKKFRNETFGDPAEAPNLTEKCAEIPDNFYCLGKWTDVMPTDGTHVEVIQAYTSAADEFSKNEIEDANSLRDALIENQKQDTELKKKALGNMTGAPEVKVKINTDRESTSG